MTFLVNAFRFGVPAPTSITLAVQDFTTGTTPATTDYTTSALGGLTPKAALILGNRHQVANDPNEDEYFGPSIGFIDDGDREITAGTFCNTGVTTGGTTGSSWGATANITYRIVNAGGGLDKSGNGLLIADGLRINWGTNSGTNRRGAFIGFAGANVSARAGSVSLGTGTSAIDVTAPGFEPDLVLFVSDNSGMTTTTSETKLTFGMATKDGTQRCMAMSEYRSTASAPFMAILTDSVGAQIDFIAGGLDYKLNANTFDSSGFSITPSASSGSDVLGYLALKFTGGAAKILDLTTPTSTGNYAITGVGFKPRAAIIVLTNLEAVDPSFPLTTDATMAGFAIGIVSDEEWAAGGRIRQGVATQETRSNFSNKAIIGPSNTNTNAIEASLVSFDSDGMTLNFTSVQGTAKKGFIAFVQ